MYVATCAISDVIFSFVLCLAGCLHLLSPTYMAGNHHQCCRGPREPWLSVARLCQALIWVILQRVHSLHSQLLTMKRRSAWPCHCLRAVLAPSFDSPRHSPLESPGRKELESQPCQPRFRLPLCLSATRLLGRPDAQLLHWLSFLACYPGRCTVAPKFSICL